MTKKAAYILWGILFAACAGLGFVPEPEGWVRYALIALAVAFFLPPAYLLAGAKSADGRKTAALVRNLAAASLILTVLTLILNFLCAAGSDTVGNAMHYLLTVVSAPMICAQSWALSLFLWACLLFWAIKILKNKKK